jgi:aminoglycoside phosphotransferase (APT) family kinase protein
VTSLPGLDLPALTRWIDAAHPGLRQGQLRAEVIAGGKSNLTYELCDDSSRWALRRPPLAHVLPTAHDMVREFRVISALSGTDVPVADAIALCEDQNVLGAPFYLMSFVEGLVFDRAEDLAGLDVHGARLVCEQLVDTLVALHAVDPDVVGLTDFGHPKGFLARQVRRWHTQWTASETRPLPELDGLVTRLEETLPEQSPAAIVHGDYRLTNVMYRRDHSGIAAVVDWEMATVGDPLTDLGLLVVYQTLAAEDDFVTPRMSPDDGFPAVPVLVQRYGAGSQRDLTNLDWYVGLGYFKLAVVAEGIHHRFLQGKTVGPGFEHFGPAVPGLLRAGLHSLEGR